MSKEDKKVPELRFKGFSDDWEQRKLETIADYGKGKLYSKNDLTDEGSQIILYGQLYTNYCVEIRSTNTFAKPKSNSIYSTGNEVIVPASGESAEDISIASSIKSPDIIIGSDLNIIYPKRFIHNTFLALTLSSGETKKRLSKFAQGKTIVHLHVNNFKKLPVSYPLFNEQLKISNFISSIERLVTLHQRKINILEKQKKEYLKLLFASNEEYFPKIRFIDFSDQWKEDKLEEYMGERTTRSAEGELISVTINSGVVKADTLQRKDNSSENKSNYKIVNKGDIAYNSMRMWQGASGLSPYEGILSPAYTVLIPKANASGTFFSYLFRTSIMLYQFTKYSQGLTSDTWNLKYPLLKTIRVKIPSKPEQLIISEFLTKFDKVIKHYQNRIDKLSEVKQIYLDKMFI